MGLAASQGRYLCLTARMSDLVYEGQQISQQRMALAKESSAVAEKYNDAMSNRVMQANIINKDGVVQQQQLTYSLITSKDPFAGLGMRLVDLDGNVVVPEKYKTIYVTNEDESFEKFTSSSDFISKYMTDLSDADKEKMGAWPVEDLVKHCKENNLLANLEFEVKDNQYAELQANGERFLYDENCKDPAYLQEMLTSGQWLLQQAVPKTVDNEAGWDDVMWQGSTQIVDVLDTSDDAAAEAEYETATKELQRRDKLLELKLEQVQTEEKSVETELESVKKIISKNIEDSFKTFA